MERFGWGKSPIVSATYENERISMKKSLDYIKCVLRLSCVVHEPIYGPFMGCTVNGFLYLYKVYQGWELQRNGPTDLPKENGPKFAPTALVASKFLLGNTR